MKNVFGLDSRDEETYSKLEPELSAAVLPHLKTTSGARASSSELVRTLQGSLTDMITFNASMVDQEPWERLSLVTVSAENDLAEASLLQALCPYHRGTISLTPHTLVRLCTSSSPT
jgi:hypothetical protein